MQLMVLGMHRSGTSVLARVLNLMGAYFGPEGVSTGANEENPKGFWERKDIRALNDSVLHGSGWDWNRIAHLDLRLVPPPILENFHKHASRLVLEMDAHRPWMMKEPRLCLLLPLWRRWLEVPIGIHIYRHPVEVASSLKKRNDIPIPVGLAMWEKYVQTATVVSADMPRIVVSHRELMTDPHTAVARLMQDLEALDVPGLRMPTAQELDVFVSTDLYREREEREDLKPYLQSRQVALFERLLTGEVPPLEAWDVAVKDLEAYESTLPPLRRPDAGTPPPHASTSVGEELRTIKGLLGKQDDEAKQRDERFVKTLRDELNSHLVAARTELQQKVADLRMQRFALYHQLREARREMTSTRQHSEDARIELAVLRPRLEDLAEQLGSAQKQLDAMRDEREALLEDADQLRAELGKARVQSEALRGELEGARSELETARQCSDGLRAELDAASAWGEAFRGKFEAARGDLEAAHQYSEGLRAELDTTRGQAESLSEELEASRAEGERLRDELVTVRARMRELRADQESLRATARERERNLESHLRDTRQELQASLASVGKLEQDVEARFRELAELTRLLLRRESELEQSKVDAKSVREQLAETTENLSKVVGSRSWRVTKPARYLGRLLTGKVGERKRRVEKESEGAALIMQSGLFDPDWYCREYPDVTKGGMDPLEHFLQYGAMELRNPGPDFNSATYLRENPDVAESGLNPLLHYLTHGRDEGRACK